MGRKRTASTEASTTPENNGTRQTVTTPKNKTEAVKLALADGLTSPTEISAHVKERYGLDVAPNHVSMIKSDLKKRKPKGKPGRKPRQAAPESVAAPARQVAAPARG